MSVYYPSPFSLSVLQSSHNQYLDILWIRTESSSQLLYQERHPTKCKWKIKVLYPYIQNFWTLLQILKIVWMTSNRPKQMGTKMYNLRNRPPVAICIDNTQWNSIIPIRKLQILSRLRKLRISTPLCYLTYNSKP